MGPPAIAPRTSIALVLVALVLTAGSAACVTAASAEQMMLAALALAGSLVLALTPGAILLSRRLRVLDIPDARKEHERPMPRLGGLAVLGAFAAAVLLALAYLPEASLPAPLRSQFLATLAAGVLIAAIGAADDKWGLKPWVRVIGQLAAVCVVMKWGVVMTFLPPTPLGRAGEVALTVFWIVGLTNALNFLDGLDGLASGVSAVAALAFGAIAAMTNQWAVATAAFALAGAALGFLKYNFRPASVYLGDGGSTFLGFTLACLGIIGDWGTHDRAVDLFVPVIVLGVPIYDTIYISVYRFRAGLVRSLSEWAAYVGRDHLHHRLQQLGLRPARTCLFICLGSGALGLLAAILETKKGGLVRCDKFLALGLTVIMFIGATILMELGRARQRSSPGGGRAEPPATSSPTSPR